MQFFYFLFYFIFFANKLTNQNENLSRYLYVFALRRLGIKSSASGTSAELYFRDRRCVLEVATRTRNRCIDSNVREKEKEKPPAIVT